MTVRPAYRVRQFRAHLWARVTPADRAAAHAVLPPSAWALFDGMPAADQRHAVEVLGRLRAAGIDDPDLLVAAALHDAGKGRRVRLWHRVVVVVVDAVSRTGVARLASADPGSVRHPFWIHLHHAELSAHAALEAGCSDRAAAFIRDTARPADAQLAAALRAADAAS